MVEALTEALGEMVGDVLPVLLASPFLFVALGIFMLNLLIKVVTGIVKEVIELKKDEIAVRTIENGRVVKDFFKVSSNKEVTDLTKEYSKWLDEDAPKDDDDNLFNEHFTERETG